jgi:hypothetical protein
MKVPLDLFKGPLFVLGQRHDHSFLSPQSVSRCARSSALRRLADPEAQEPFRVVQTNVCWRTNARKSTKHYVKSGASN